MPDDRPGFKSHADRRFGIVDPAVNLVVLTSLEEGARGEFFPAGIHPVVNTGNTLKVFRYKTCSSAGTAVSKADQDVVEDILPAPMNPGYKIFSNPFLVPPPLLAALSALSAVLGRHGLLSPLVFAGDPARVIFPVTEGLQEKTAMLHNRTPVPDGVLPSVSRS